MLPAPGFHHLHLNSVDPDAAIDFYARQFPTSARASWGGLPALASPNDVLVLFTRVATPPATSPQTAIWHFGWHVTDTRARLESYESRPDVRLLPLYTTEEGGSVFHPAERFNHVHLYQEEPFCAQLWYQTHLSAPVFRGRASATPVTESTCKVPRGSERSWPALERQGMFRSPTAAVVFGDVALPWYMRQGDRPLVSTRGHLYDHIALSVADLDAWVAKLRSEGVRFLEKPYELGDSRAVMIEGPSREALELVEVA